MNLWTELCHLAYKYGSDKCYEIKHPFTPYYYELFKDMRNDVKKFLEIGVGYPAVMERPKTYTIGASLYMWRDFFPNAQIYGADINKDILFEADRIKTFECDQTHTEDVFRLMSDVGDDVDIVIDDGLHTLKSQVNTCLDIMPFLKDGAIYIVEDVVSDKVAKYLKQYNAELITFPIARHFDDRLVIMRK
jgi:hypothetical protein